MKKKREIKETGCLKKCYFPKFRNFPVFSMNFSFFLWKFLSKKIILSFSILWLVIKIFFMETDCWNSWLNTSLGHLVFFFGDILSLNCCCFVLVCVPYVDRFSLDWFSSIFYWLEKSTIQARLFEKMEKKVKGIVMKNLRSLSMNQTINQNNNGQILVIKSSVCNIEKFISSSKKLIPYLKKYHLYLFFVDLPSIINPKNEIVDLYFSFYSIFFFNFI